METIQEEQKIIVKYLREKDQYQAKIKFVKGEPEAYLHTIPGHIIGCIIAVNKNVVGWSLLNKSDKPWEHWSWYEKSAKEQRETLKVLKNRSFQIAYNRAMIADSMDSDQLFNYYSKAPFTLMDEVVKLQERSEKYFK